MESPPTIGKYELLRRIGVGGMASVYLSRVRGAEGFARIYALKVMHAHLAGDPSLVTMMLDEARIASRLTHPNIVSTVDVGHEDGFYYIALEYVDGVALDRLFARKPEYRPPQLIVPIATDALLGLAAAHEMTDAEGLPLEIVHRDVTPGNVIVGVDGRTLITDFGIAKARARATKTNPGIVKGKAGYIAPEVALGREVDHRADIFSMGVLLWNALTGRALYDTNDLAKSITALVTMHVPPPSTIGLRPPAILDHAIMKALHRNPRERFQSGREMSEALQDALAMIGGEPPRRRIGEWVEVSFAQLLAKRRAISAPEVPLEPEPNPESHRDDPTRSFKLVRDEEPQPGETPEWKDDTGSADFDSLTPTAKHGPEYLEGKAPDSLPRGTTEVMPGLAEQEAKARQAKLGEEYLEDADTMFEAPKEEKRGCGRFVLLATVTLIAFAIGAVLAWLYVSDGTFSLEELRRIGDDISVEVQVEPPAVVGSVPVEVISVAAAKQV